MSTVNNSMADSKSMSQPLWGVKPNGAALSYVLVTPARNEVAFIEQTIKSVVGQRILPKRWVIVSDGSTDGTDEIVQRYAQTYDWIELVRMPERRERHFAGKVSAFNAGFERLADVEYDLVGNLDADITFDQDYFSFLLGKFAELPKLGVGGTPFREGVRQYDFRYTSINHVSGACQLFRRECFQQIGGYRPTPIGGIDLVAVITARMNGWQTQSFIEKTSFHHRTMGTGMHKGLKVHFKGGRGDYMLGGHPVWEIFRTFYQIMKKPYVIGGALRLIGFYWAMLSGEPKCVSDEFVAFRRGEQMERMRCFLKGLWPVRFVG